MRSVSFDRSRVVSVHHRGAEDTEGETWMTQMKTDKKLRVSKAGFLFSTNLSVCIRVHPWFKGHIQIGGR